MNKVLYLLRHGKSDWSEPVSDYRRPLKERGRHESVRLGAWLRSNDHVPQKVKSSTAARARETAHLVTAAMGLDIADIACEEGLYMASAGTLLEYLSETSEDITSLMLVGHNPGMEDLLMQLAGKSLPTARLLKALPTATVACLNVGERWAEISAATSSLLFIHRGRAD